MWREWLRFFGQRGRFFSALVRPFVWLGIFAAGFRFTLGVSIIPPYETYIPYEVYVAPGLAAMIQLFNGMQSSLSMVYDREMGSMRVLLTSPLPRWYLLTSKLLAGVAVSVLQVYAFLAIALLWEVEPPWWGYITVLPALALVGHDAGRARAAALVHHPAAREFRGGDELRDLPDVLRLLGALPALARQGRESVALVCLRDQPIHTRGRADPVCALRECVLGFDAAVSGYLVLFLVVAVWGYDPARGLVARRGGAE